MSATLASESGLKGRLFDIQRFAIHDGPGIRTTVFLKGCPLRCVWCHNPEGIDARPLISFDARNCIGCGYCFRVCPNQVHRMDPERGHVMDRERCEACGRCATECYAGGLQVVGREASVEEVLAEVLRDRPFYEQSGGGMTLSGGEPLLQIGFTAALLRAAQAAGLHCAVETCGQVEYERLERIRPDVDLFLYDLKETDPERHREYTGTTNERVLANLRRLHDADATILLRLPIVPGLNDRDGHFAAVAETAAGLPNLQGVEVMPYHRLGTGKRERMGLKAEVTICETPDQETVAGWVRRLRERGVKVVNQD